MASLKNCRHHLTYVEGFCINITLYEAFKLHITVVLSTEKLLGCAVGHSSVLALDTCQKDMLAKPSIFTLTVFGCFSLCLFFEPQLKFKFLSS